MKVKRNTLVCFALKEEAAPFRKWAATRPDVAVLIVGIGRENAERSIRKFLDACRRPATTALENSSSRPDQVFTCGFAGGLNPDLKIGDVVFELQGMEVALQSQLLAAGAKPAKFLCVDRIATTVAEKRQLHERTRAEVVEMESAAIQAVCAEQGVPCATVRVISDTAYEDLPLDFNALSKPDKSLDFGKLAWAIVKSPGKIGALMALQKKTSLAAGQMTAVLAKVIS